MGTVDQVNRKKSPWIWVPSLYFFQGIPYSLVMITSGLIYKTMGIPLAVFTLWSSLLYLPWTLKPLWSPTLEMIGTKRGWIVLTQLILGLLFLFLGFSMQLPHFFLISLVLFGLVAFLSASHDIAADGFYMLALDTHHQSLFVGIRSTFYRMAMLTALGLIPLLAGFLQEKTGLKPVTLMVQTDSHSVPTVSFPEVTKAIPSEGGPQLSISAHHPYHWGKDRCMNLADSLYVDIVLTEAPGANQTIVVTIDRLSGSKDISLSSTYPTRFEFNSGNWRDPRHAGFSVDANLTGEAKTLFRAKAGDLAYSWMVALGSVGLLLILLAIYHLGSLPKPLQPAFDKKGTVRVYREVFTSFFSKPGIAPAMIFFLMYRLGEGQLVKVATPFLVDSRTAGGIGMSAAQYGLAYGTVGMLALTFGGIFGGFIVSRYGLKRMIWIMALSMNLPVALYVYLASFQPMPDHWSVYASIASEQFGYGFGFTAYMIFMLSFVGESPYKTAEFAIGTSLMALGMMVPGMISGLMKEWLGYAPFFIYVMICAIPGMGVIRFLKIDSGFGKKNPSTTSA